MCPLSNFTEAVTTRNYKYAQATKERAYLSYYTICTDISYEKSTAKTTSTKQCKKN